MNAQKSKKLSIKKIVSLAGVATASVLLSVPAFAQVSPSNGQNNENGASTGEQQIDGRRQPSDDRFPENQGASENNGMNNDIRGTNQDTNNTTNRMERPSTTGTQPGAGQRQPTDDRFMQNQTVPQNPQNNRSNNDSTRGTYQPSTTGAGYPGNGVTPSSGTRTLERRSTESNTESSTQMNRPSSTGAGYPGNGVTPSSGTRTMQEQSTTNDINTVNQQSPDQGVRALW